MQFDTDPSPTENSIVRPSSLTRRFIAFCLDGLLVAILGAFGSGIVPVVGTAVVWFFYAPILESSAVQATIGKHLMGIQVCDLSGRRVSLRTALMRNLLKIVSFALLLIGFFIAIFSERKQALHDHLAETLVVYGRSNVPLTDAWMTSVKNLFKSLNT